MITLQDAESMGKIRRNPDGDIYMVVLDDMELTMIPDWVFKITTLKILMLSNNKITYIPDDIRNLHYLERVHLCNNNITVLPYVFLYFTGTFFQLRGNPLNKESLMLLFREKLATYASFTFKYPKNNFNDPEDVHRLYTDDCNIMEWFERGGDLFAWKWKGDSQWNYGDIEIFFTAVPSDWAYEKVLRVDLK